MNALSVFPSMYLSPRILKFEIFFSDHTYMDRSTGIWCVVFTYKNPSHKNMLLEVFIIKYLQYSESNCKALISCIQIAT